MAEELTVRESILADLETTLSGISKANGYNNDIESVQRWKMHGNSLVDVPCIVINAGPEDKSFGPNPLISCNFKVYLDLWIRQNEDAADSTDKVLNSFLGDIEKALMVDITRGGNASNTHLLSNTLFETVEGNPHAGLIIELEIHYRHYKNNPCQSA